MSQQSRRWLGLCFCLGFVAAAVWWQQPQVTQPGIPRSTAKEVGKWERLDDCKLVPHKYNDGDSFLVQHRLGTSTFRLYFVDTCEKERYAKVKDRITDQATHFGIGEDQVLTLGAMAKKEALHWLETTPFSVATKWESVYDSGRFYAHVQLKPADGPPEWLAERLIRLGLARIHTKGEDIPRGPSRNAFTKHLRDLEYDARRQQRGGWGMAQ